MAITSRLKRIKDKPGHYILRVSATTEKEWGRMWSHSRWRVRLFVPGEPGHVNMVLHPKKFDAARNLIWESVLFLDPSRWGMRADCLPDVLMLGRGEKLVKNRCTLTELLKKNKQKQPKARSPKPTRAELRFMSRTSLKNDNVSQADVWQKLRAAAHVSVVGGGLPGLGKRK